jgi:hypothetical protein
MEPHYRWNGAYGRGAMREHRAGKRREAEERNAATQYEYTAAYRRERHGETRKGDRKIRRQKTNSR